MARQVPYPIYGTVYYRKYPGASSTALKGAKIWVVDLTEGTMRMGNQEGRTVFHTNNNGRYILDLATLTEAYSNADIVRIYIQAKGVLTYEDISVNVSRGYSQKDITITKRSGLTDGFTPSVDPRNRYSLTRGLKVGLKDGMQ